MKAAIRSLAVALLINGKFLPEAVIRDYLC
jgi:hypothetical protein